MTIVEVRIEEKHPLNHVTKLMEYLIDQTRSVQGLRTLINELDGKGDFEPTNKLTVLCLMTGEFPELLEDIKELMNKDPSQLELKSGRTALMYSALYAGCLSSPETITLLLSHPNTPVNACTKEGQTALIFACGFSHRTSCNKAVRALLNDPRVDPNLCNYTHGLPALAFAGMRVGAKLSTVKSVKLLLDNPKVDVNITFSNDINLLHLSCSTARNFDVVKVIQLLLEHPDTDPNALSGAGLTPLSILLSKEDNIFTPMVFKLFMKRPDIDLKNVSDLLYKTRKGYLVKYIPDDKFKSSLSKRLMPIYNKIVKK